LYWLAVALPLAAFFAAAMAGLPRRRIQLAKVLSLAAMTELVAAFVLRTPLVAHVPAVVPLILLAGACIAGIGRGAGRSPVPQERRAPRSWLAPGCGAFAFVLTAAGVGELMGIPPLRNFLVTERLSEYARVPPARGLLPKAPMAPLVEYLRECTHPSDRVLIGWFAPEVYFFSGRGFAAGLPVVFNEHWSGLRYQRRSIDLLRQESVPVIVTSHEGEIEQYDLLWNFIRGAYELAGDVSLSEELSGLRVWTRKDLPRDQRWNTLALPCIAR
jgi:hypothetical protein